MGLADAFPQPTKEAHEKLQGAWIATQAERDGKAADDIVAHRVSFTGNRFQIQSEKGKLLYAGTIRVEPRANPAAIDFGHTKGTLKGKTWKGIYALDGGTLTICDNAANPDKGSVRSRPTSHGYSTPRAATSLSPASWISAAMRIGDTDSGSFAPATSFTNISRQTMGSRRERPSTSAISAGISKTMIERRA
jgi:uncharacterized protein (TIGR03067 family)